MNYKVLGILGGGMLPDDSGALRAQCELAVLFLQAIVGKAPGGCTLDVADLADGGPTIMLRWTSERAPIEYWRRCRMALDVLNDAWDTKDASAKAFFEAQVSDLIDQLA